jgi:hypothetical protein
VDTLHALKTSTPERNEHVWERLNDRNENRVYSFWLTNLPFQPALDVRNSPADSHGGGGWVRDRPMKDGNYAGMAKQAHFPDSFVVP